MPKIINLENQKFNRLTVLYRNGTTKDGQILWHCKCDCGNEKDIASRNLRSGHTKSCGCLQKEKTKLMGESQKHDLSGQTYNFLTVIEPTEQRVGSNIVWKCLCICGKEHYVAGANLVAGKIKSCGCKKKELISQNSKIVMINKTFGKLKVIEEAGSDPDHSLNYLCQCECGNQKIINGVSLRQGITTSCGCINYSIGEKNIKEILDKNNINYIKEYAIKELNNKRFDFAIIENNKIVRLIEFDGRQHYESSPIWDKCCSLEERQNRDFIKNEYAKNNNIPLVRIPYWERDNITLEMLMGEQYLIK